MYVIIYCIKVYGPNAWDPDLPGTMEAVRFLRCFLVLCELYLHLFEAEIEHHLH